jgi:hypothetical protein
MAHVNFHNQDYHTSRTLALLSHSEESQSFLAIPEFSGQLNAPLVLAEGINIKHYLLNWKSAYSSLIFLVE